MYIVLISLIFIFIFFFILLVNLNFILFNWENSKVILLTRLNDKTKNQDYKIDTQKKYIQDITSNTQNLLNITTNNSIKVFGKLYNEAIIQMPKNYKISSSFKNIKYSEYLNAFFRTGKNIFFYILSLIKPATIESDEFLMQNEEVDKITDHTDLRRNDNNYIKPDISSNINTDQPKNTDYQKFRETATIGLVSVDKNKSIANDGEISTFDKLENRILSKLKESGMSNYDIWLELGDLYLKYNENKKAMEVYALVLKHSKNEKHKELARNGLIGM
ncbi:MAG: hypothetical protein H7196_02375 [candidate division SR1 bacterium]|nr:hypothetical protein [candidate division SR1 bacterium]